MKKIKITISTVILVIASTTLCHAREPEMIVSPLIFFFFPVLSCLIFVMPLGGIKRKLAIIFLFFSLNVIVITWTLMNIDNPTTQEAILFSTPLATWIISIAIAFICKKFHLIDSTESK